MATKKTKVETQQVESLQEQPVIVPAALEHTPVEPPVGPAEQPADRSAGKTIGEPPPEKSLEERVERLIDFLIYVDGCPIDYTPQELAEEFGLTLPQFNSIRRQLAARGIEIRFMRKGRKPLVDVAKFMGDGPDEEINLQG